MENTEPTVAAEGATQETPTTEPQTSAEAQAPAPLPTYQAINADAPVVTADQIEERIKKAGGDVAPLSAIRDAKRRKRAEESGDGVKPSDGSSAETGEKRERRPRRERGDRPERKIVAPRRPQTSAVLPNRREGLSGDLEDEFAALIEGQELETMMTSSVDANVNAEQLEEGTKVTCRVETITKDSVFVNIGSTELGLIPLKQFPDDMELTVGQTFDAVVTRFNREDGYYEVSLPLAAAEVGDWLSISKDAIVEARVTGVNKGGLEVEVGKLRGFMPAGHVQTADFDLASAEQFIGTTWKCVVIEVNPERRNLVVSRRKLMQMERAEMREKTLAELAVGETREGTVRKLIDVGAFVDLGGIDGLLHISEMSWGRVENPAKLYKEGDPVKVFIKDIKDSKIALSRKFPDENPWNDAAERFAVGNVVKGRVARMADFGAFIELAPGIDGLLHVSQISKDHIDKPSDVLTVGQEVEARVVELRENEHKISLSLKALNKSDEDEAENPETEEAEAAAPAEDSPAAEELKEEA